MNSLGIELENKHVILSNEYYKGSIVERVFKCTGGFGCDPDTMGKAVFGLMLYDGEKFRAEGYQIERLATDQEISDAKEIRKRGVEIE